MAKLQAKIDKVSYRLMSNRLAQKLKELEEFAKYRGQAWQDAQDAIGSMLVAEVRDFLDNGHKRSGMLSESIKYSTSKNSVEVFSDKDEFKGVNKTGTPIKYYAPWVEEGVHHEIKPKQTTALVFYNPYEADTPLFRTKVQGQEGLHFMERTRKNPKVKEMAKDILLDFAIKCIADEQALRQRVNASGNRRGWNFTSAARKFYNKLHGNTKKKGR